MTLLSAFSRAWDKKGRLAWPSDKRAGFVMLKSRVQILIPALDGFVLGGPEFKSFCFGNSCPFSTVSFTSVVENGHQQSLSVEKLNLKANKGEYTALREWQHCFIYSLYICRVRPVGVLVPLPQRRLSDLFYAFILNILLASSSDLFIELCTISVLDKMISSKSRHVTTTEIKVYANTFNSWRTAT